jgi:hypothetical protein
VETVRWRISQELTKLVQVQIEIETGFNGNNLGIVYNVEILNLI